MHATKDDYEDLNFDALSTDLEETVDELLAADPHTSDTGYSSSPTQ